VDATSISTGFLAAGGLAGIVLLVLLTDGSLRPPRHGRDASGEHVQAIRRRPSP
jgi:hypothetical protein